ncbi:hypothetical protein ACQEVF_58545 [Nonomuraea polychroma]|uniref:hypothetical protein n=1 Tax=Nonomuraea polychroma TaxID=46176 RepID=UPI003D8D3072
MTTINIDDGSAITINIPCGDGGEEPDPVTEPYLPYAVNGLVCAAVQPELLTSSQTMAGPLLVAARAYLPPRISLAHVGIAVTTPAVGTPATECRLAVYHGGVGEKLGQTENKPTLYTRSGWRFANLETPIPAADTGRIVWLVATVPNFSQAGPSLACTPDLASATLLNAWGYRAVEVGGATTLPPMFDNDAPDVDFTMITRVCGLTAGPGGIAQP